MRDPYDELGDLYEMFDADSAEYRKGAVCAKGCAFCCTDAGSIDMTTLEGLRIRDHIERLPRARRIAVRKAVARDMKKREAGGPSACPFLMKNQACQIYPIRPFACRRIYSLRKCSKDHPPLVDRQAMRLAQETIAALQRLDGKGYSGHMSFILHMLDTPAFFETYTSGDFKPEEVMAFGKTHRIFINKQA